MAQLFSMTSFARHQQHTEFGLVVWELRSVNHRFLETAFRLPEAVRDLEFSLRDRLRTQVSRGKVDGSLKIEWTESQASLDLNQPLLEQLIQLRTELGDRFIATAPVEPLELLRWPGVLQSRSVEIEQVQAAVMQGFELCVQQLLASRAQEGQALAQLIRQRIAGIRQQVERVQQEMPVILQWQRERLVQKLRELSQDLNLDRLEQELVLSAQKIDVAEEMDRLLTHANEVDRLLQEGGAIGRRLDFLMQELNREANTLSSKSINSQTTAAAIEMKVLIEQMREQIQNIE